MSNELTPEDNAKLLTHEQMLIEDMNERLKALETLHEERIDSIESVQYVIDNFLKLSFKDNSPEFRQKVYKKHQEFLIKINDILKSKDRKKEDNLDLVKLETQLDEALSKETPETLTEWLLNKRKCAQPDNEETYQTTPVNGEWKENEWCIAPDRDLFLITEVKENGALEGDTQGFEYPEILVPRSGLSLCKKPTVEQILYWLIKIASQRYHIGTKLLQSSYTIKSNKFEYDKEDNALYGFVEEIGGRVCLWIPNHWAETTNETTPKEVDQKERWKPEPMEIYWAIDDTFNAYKTVGSGAERVKAGNCFPTEEAATKAAQLIRETLKQL